MLSLVFFNGEGHPDISDYMWDFGDGTKQTTNSPNSEHTYKKAGTYSASLHVTGDFGSSFSEERIIVSGIAKFNTSTFYEEAPGTIAFFGPEHPGIVAYLWDFGDGSPISSSTTTDTKHTYKEAGNYTVSLTVSGDFGTDTWINSISATKGSPPVAHFLTPPPSPILSLPRSESLHSGEELMPMTFTNTSSGEIDRYTWNFGDGKKSNQKKSDSHL